MWQIIDKYIVWGKIIKNEEWNGIFRGVGADLVSGWEHDSYYTIEGYNDISAKKMMGSSPSKPEVWGLWRQVTIWKQHQVGGMSLCPKAGADEHCLGEWQLCRGLNSCPSRLGDATRSFLCQCPKGLGSNDLQVALGRSKAPGGNGNVEKAEAWVASGGPRPLSHRAPRDKLRTQCLSAHSHTAPARRLLNPGRRGWQRPRGAQGGGAEAGEESGPAVEPQPGAAAAGAVGPGETQRHSAGAPPEPGEPSGDEAEAQQKAAEATVLFREPLWRPVVVGPRQEELGPGGKPGTASGQPGWGNTPVVCWGGGETARLLHPQPGGKHLVGQPCSQPEHPAGPCRGRTLRPYPR